MNRLTLSGLSVLLVGSAMWVSRGDSPVPAAPERAVWAFGPVQPRVSPDGAAIAFSYLGSIWRMPAVGGAATRLTTAPGFDVEPAWSPDGGRIAYFAGASFFGGELRVVRATDGGPVLLPAKVQGTGKLHFDPQGQRILGNFQTPGGETLAWYSLSDGRLTPLTAQPRAARRGALAPDGRWVAFATNQDVPGQQGGNDGPQADLWKLATDASDAVPQRIAQFPARIHDVCWSADGQSLTVTTDLGGAYYDLWQIPLADPARGARKLTFGQADEDRPSWSRDGRLLVYTDNHEGCTALVARDVTLGSDRAVAVTQLDFGTSSGTLKLITRENKGAVTARVCIEQSGGKFHAPLESLYRIERGNLHFYCPGAAEVELPAGRYELRAYRGPEYRAARHSLQIEPGKPTTLEIDIERWIDAATLGWFSGENHIHANYGYGEWYNTPASMGLQCQGEDLNVCNFMVANSDGDGTFDRAFFRGRPDVRSEPYTVLYWNQEFRSTIWGHMTLVNLRQLVEPIFTGFKDTTNPWDIPTNSDIADRTHLQNGLVNYTHVAQNEADPYSGPYTGKGLPIDVALGKIDSVDINNNYAGSVALWHRILNCGFRLPASAGTDCFLNRIRSRLPGSDRAYVQIEGSFSYARWIEGLREGRSFVSNGPVLELSVNGRGLGAVVALDGPAEVRVRARARSQWPLDRAELILNGKVVAQLPLKSTDRLDAQFEQPVRIERSGWLALRANGPAHPDNPAGPSYAHTSPIYFQVRGRPVAAADDARFFLAWIDRLDAAVRQRGRIPNEALRSHVAQQLDAARAVYRRLAAE
jgi:hypothetical protein